MSSVAPIEAGRIGPFLPPIVHRHDRALPLLVVLSLVAHAAVVAPSLFIRHAATQSPREIPVELVQLPPEPPKPAKPTPKPAPPKAEQPKPPSSKPSEVKPATPNQAKPEPPKPTPPKPAPRKPAPPKPAPPKQTPPKQEQAKAPPQKAEQAKPQPRSQVPGKEATPSGAERYKSLMGAMPALALPGTSADGTEQVSYSQLVLSRVAKAKKEGRFRGMPGAASVAFTIDDNGGIASIEIVRPSGIADLDAEALAMIRRGAPYPPPPPGGRRDYTITLRFQPLI